MPVVIRDLENRSCPAVVCNHCGEPITDVRDGNYQWRMELHDTDFGRVAFVAGVGQPGKPR